MADESSFKENNEEKMQSVNVNPRKKKICQICGDFSLGFNFGAVSCESCKAFFRRNAAKMKVFPLNYSYSNVYLFWVQYFRISIVHFLTTAALTWSQGGENKYFRHFRIYERWLLNYFIQELEKGYSFCNLNQIFLCKIFG